MINKWNEEEIKILKKLYPKGGAKPIAKKLGRSPASVMTKAAKLGIKYKGRRYWAKWEDNYMRRHYDDRKNRSIAKTLKRSVHAVLGRARFLNLRGAKAKAWTEKEIDILRQMYPYRKHSLKEISQIINRTPYAILLKAQTLGINRPAHDHEWTKEERNYLIKNYKTKTYKEIAEDLGLTHSSVCIM